MSIDDIVRTVDLPAKRLLVSGERPPSRALRDIGDFFDVDRSAITYSPRPVAEPVPNVSAPPHPQRSFVSIYNEESDEPLLTADVETLRTAVTSDAESLNTSLERPEHPTRIFESAGGTAVSSHTIRQMIVVSRHIERLSREFSGGEIHACFQRLSLLGNDLKTTLQYNLLAEAGVDVHIYGFDDHDLPEIETPTVHRSPNEELKANWVVAFDSVGERDTGRSAALVARERAPDEYAGFWTFEPAIVDAVIECLSTTYQ